MAAECLIVIKSEDAYFQKKEVEKIRELREKAKKEKTELYCDEHRNHCFRCGTGSLVEVQKGNVAIDICVNEGCGAVHLDPGELETILQDSSQITSIRASILNIFT